MKTTWTILLMGIQLGVYAQDPDNYPQDYFRNPLDIPIYLAGNFGECRPNHFHTGIDIKTDQKENMKVYAAAEGYVSRISISHSGYGNALYIRHPNGYTTLYGHLNDFFPELQQYLKQQQYNRESWNVDLELRPDQFPVKKGQFVAFSGTTGGSTGPHVHFEIRDNKTQHVLNAALFGIPIHDRMAPVAKSIALYGNKSIYETAPAVYPLKRKGNNYSPATELLKTKYGIIRVGVLADDFMEGSMSTLGTYQMRLYLDEQLQVSWRLNDINFDQNRYVNAFADYRLKEEKDSWFQGLYRLPGNKLDAYTFLNKKDGALDISDGHVHAIRIEMEDASGNLSQVTFSVQSSNTASEAHCGQSWFKANTPNSLLTKTILFNPPAEALYDDICFDYKESYSAKNFSNTVQLQNNKIPLHTYTDLGIKLNKPVPFELRTKLVFVHHIKAASLPGNNPQSAMAARHDKGWAWASVRTFGNYYVSIDTTAPSIKPLQKTKDFSKARVISFQVKDNLTSVKSFRAELNGKWLCFVRAGNTFTYTFDEYCPKGRHALKITAVDENDNKREYSLNFTR